METMDAIAKRQSCRNFNNEPLSEEVLTKILEAGNAAPVAMKKYEDVKITVIKNPDIFKKMEEAAEKMLQKPDMHPLYNAPVVIVVSGKKMEGGQTPQPYCNAACIVENMSLAATDMGLGSCYLMGVIVATGLDEELCEEIKIPQGFVPCAGIALGYFAEAQEKRNLTTKKIQTEFIV